MAKKEEIGVSENLLEGIDLELEDLDSGLEGVTRTMSSFPVAKLTQNMTPEVTNRDYKDIFAGMFINDSTKTPIGESMEINVIRSWQQRTKFAPRDAGGAVECSCPTYTQNDTGTDRGTEHGLCCRCIYNTFTEADHCQVQAHLVVAVNGDPDNLYRIILSKTSYKAYAKVRKLLQTLSNRNKVNGKPLPSCFFTLRASAKEASSKNGNRWYVWDFEAASDKPNIPKDKVQDFLDVARDIKELREDVIEDHKKRVASQPAQQPASVATDLSDAGDSLAKEMGFTASVNDEEVPF